MAQSYDRRINLYINVDGKTVKNDVASIKGELQKIINQQARMTIGSAEYNAEAQKIKYLKGILKEHTAHINQVQKSWSMQKMADGFNRYFGMITAFAASFTGVVMGFKKASQAYAEFEDKVADVQKTTGLTKDEVLELDKSLQKLDTRTAQEGLLDLAKVAGKLGISAQEDVEGFVRAADKVAVALTEDLGGNIEQSVNDLGKLIDIFQLKDEFGMEKSMLKVGSAINSLGAAGTANEGYIVEFTKRMAGVAPAAQISIDQVMGLGATLDQFGQTSEISSTTISAVWTDMFKAPGEYAKIAGMSLKDFNDLLNTDANEAFIKFLTGLKGNNGGLAEMANKLDGLGLEGKRSISVLGVLANNTETLRTQQKLSSDEFNKGTSLINEFNIKNETMQARLDKSRKDLALMTRELGSNLSPAMLVSTNGITYFIKGLSAGIKIFKEYYPLIVGASVAIAAYTIALKFNTAEKKASFLLTKLGAAAEATYSTVKALLTGQIKVATIAQRAWNAAVASNPIGAVIAVVLAVGAAIWQYSKNVNAASAAQKALNEVETIALQNTVEQKQKVEELLSIAKDEARSLDERRAAIEALNKISPEYYGNLTLEKINTEEAKKATDDYIKSIEQKARVQAAQEMLTELEKERIKAVREGTDIELSTMQKLWNAATSFGNASLLTSRNVVSGIKNQTKAEQEYQEQKKALSKIIGEGSKTDPTTPIGSRKTIGDQVLEWDGTKWKLVQDLGDRDSPAGGDPPASAENISDELIKVLAEDSEKTKDAINKYFNEAGEGAFDAFMSAIEKKQSEGSIDFSVIPETAPEEEVADPANDYAMQKMQETLDYQLLLNETKYKQGVIGEQEYQDELTRITQEGENKRLSVKQEAIQKAQMLAELGGNFVSALMDYELEKAGDNEEKKKEIRKKYADANFAVTAANIIANTAGAIMKGYEQLGPIGGTIAAVLLGATGIVQLGIANQQRQKAKGYSDGGFTGDGGKLEPAGIVHKGEWVAPNWMVDNPITASIIRNLEDWRQNPVSIRPEAAKLTESFRPFSSGGYTSPAIFTSPSLPVSPSSAIDPATANRIASVLERLESWEPSVAVETYERKREKYNEISNNGLK